MVSRTPIDSAAVASVIGVARYRVQELARFRERASALAAAGDGAQRAEARAYLRDEAIPAWLPLPQRPRLWTTGSIYRWALRTRRLDAEALVPRRKPAPGRPVGGPPALRRHRASLPQQLAALAGVHVDAGLQAALRELLGPLYARLRAAGVPAAAARAQAAAAAAAVSGAAAEQADKVMLQVAAEEVVARMATT
jgi:hypothetical protein